MNEPENLVPASIDRRGMRLRLYLFRGQILMVPADMEAPPEAWPLYVDRRKP